MEKFTKSAELVASAKKWRKHLMGKQDKAAGTRLRNALEQIKVAAADIRKEVIDKKNEGK